MQKIQKHVFQPFLLVLVNTDPADLPFIHC